MGDIGWSLPWEMSCYFQELRDCGEMIISQENVFLLLLFIFVYSSSSRKLAMVDKERSKVCGNAAEGVGCSGWIYRWTGP